MTGVGRDIGRVVVERLASERSNVAINYFSSPQGADEAVEAITACGGQAIALHGDLKRKADADALVQSAVGAFGGVDILVNNAGGLIARKTVAEMSLEHWDAVMRFSLTSTFLMNTSLPCPHDK